MAPSTPTDLLAHIQHWLGDSLERLYRFDEAEHAYRIAHDLREQLVAAQPNNVGFRRALAHLNEGFVIPTVRRSEDPTIYAQQGSCGFP